MREQYWILGEDATITRCQTAVCTAFFFRVTQFEPVIFPALDFAAAFFTAEFACVYFLCVFFHEKTPKSQTKTVKHKLNKKNN